MNTILAQFLTIITMLNCSVLLYAKPYKYNSGLRNNNYSESNSVISHSKKKLHQIYVRSIQSKKLEFLSYIEVSNKRSFVNQLNIENKIGFDSLHLIDKLKKAKKLELIGETHLAYLNYLNISKLRLNYQWDEDHRSIIHYSILKLSELDIKNQTYWIKNALAFDYNNKSNLKYLKKSTQRVFNKISKKIKKTQAYIPPEFYEYDEIWINGLNLKMSQLKKYHFISNEKYLVSLYSNVYFPKKLTLTLKELNQYEQPPQFIVEGTCDDSKVNPEVNFKFSQSLYGYFNQDCSVQLNPKINQELSKKNNLNKQDLFTISKPKQLDLSQSTKKMSSNKWYKNKWLWVAVGALVSYKVYEQNQPRAKKPTNYPKPTNQPQDNEIEEL